MTRKLFEWHIVVILYQHSSVTVSTCHLLSWKRSHLSLELGAVDAPELQAHFRSLCSLGGALGMKSGICIDMEAPKPDGTHWDFGDDSDVADWFRALT
eukprot:9501081-Pyramimonas_sp.AAC.1